MLPVLIETVLRHSGLGGGMHCNDCHSGCHLQSDEQNESADLITNLSLTTLVNIVSSYGEVEMTRFLMWCLLSGEVLYCTMHKF